MPQHIVIIGSVALGPKSACRLKRLVPGAKVTMIDQSEIISYGGCGIPYFISGDVSDARQLQATSFNMLRDKKFFKDAKDIDVLTGTRATAIHRDTKTVEIVDIASGEKRTLSYDRLVIATGSLPRRLNIPGSDLENIHTVTNMEDAIQIQEKVAGGQVGSAVIVGAGLIGLELAESMADLWGIDTTVIKIRNDQLLRGLIGPNIANMVRHHLQENDVNLLLGEKILRFEGDGAVQQVVTEKRTLETDLVIIAVGFKPNAELARDAGLEIGETGGIIVNQQMQTSDPDIYAGGDCVEIPNLITGKPGYFPFGSLANRQGRVIGTNLAGGHASFEGAVGSFALKLFEISISGAGLTLDKARENGFDAFNAFVIQFDRAHFYPEKDLMYLELIVERGTGRVLGIQGMGNKGDGMVGRINAVADLLKRRPTTEDISNLELPYSPPFSAAMDILNALGNTAENILCGMNRVVEPEDFCSWWMQREQNDVFFMDCRGWGNAAEYVERHPKDWISIPQDELRGRMGEVPQDRPIVLICNTGVRSYEAQITLDEMGIRDTYNLQGGMAAIKKIGFDI